MLDKYTIIATILFIFFCSIVLLLIIITFIQLYFKMSIDSFSNQLDPSLKHL